MMAVNRGKQFEDIIKKSFEKISEVSIDRLHDQTNGFSGSSNIADFIVYKEPYEIYIECKSTKGNTLSIHSNDPKRKYGAISNKQWEGLLEKSKIQGVFAGVIVWFIDMDRTFYMPIQILEYMRAVGYKSVNCTSIKQALDNGAITGIIRGVIEIQGKKKRVFFDYDMEKLLNRMKG